MTISINLRTHPNNTYKNINIYIFSLFNKILYIQNNCLRRYVQAIILLIPLLLNLFRF